MPSSLPTPSGLLLDLYELTMAQSYFFKRRGARATFDLFVRSLPLRRSYLLFAGLQEALAYLADMAFEPRDLVYLSRIGFKRDFLRYLEGFRFRGDVWAMPEGTVFFPQEPILRITGSLIETQVVESALLNRINLATMIATKASRIVQAAKGRGVYDFSLRRTHGPDAALAAARSAFIAGFRGTSNVLAARTYDIPAVGTMAHSFVMSFESEKKAFWSFFETFPDRCILLVDTYNTLEGIKNAIAVAKAFKAKGHLLRGIRLDSGDLLRLSQRARRLLDLGGFKKTKIFASGDLDEYKIEKLLAAGAAIDDFGVGTKMGVSYDAPSLDAIYKIAEVTNDKGVFLPTMKLSVRKATLPARKQVFRLYDGKGSSHRDIIGLESEHLGAPLLEKVMEKGRLVSCSRSLAKIRGSALKNVASLGKRFRSLEEPCVYPVSVSPLLKKTIRGLCSELKNRQL